jgi:hypothetical protein
MFLLLLSEWVWCYYNQIDLHLYAEFGNYPVRITPRKPEFSINPALVLRPLLYLIDP